MIKTRAIEFDKILAELSAFAQSGAAVSKILKIFPTSDFKTVAELLRETEIADIILYEHSISPSFAINDLSEVLEKAGKSSTLSFAEIMSVGLNMRAAARLKEIVLNISDERILDFKTRSERIYEDNKLETDIDKAFISDTEMADGASALLREIRGEIKRINEKIRTKLNGFIANSAFQKYLQDNLITLRNNRYVLPIKSEYRSAVKGLVHDQSASGATIYVEPLEIVELNNDLKERTIEERREIENILKEFTLRIGEAAEKLAENDDIVTDFDVIFAKAKYAKSIKAVKPELNDKGIIDIKEGRHPLIPRENVVPVSVTLGENYNILLITGPNTGGKTVTLKMAGLFAVMAMSGLFLPCEPESRISVFDNVFVDVGDEQSIEQSLSTFSAHIKNIIEITNEIDAKSLALIDELGAGTDPAEGGALAQSVLDYILKSGARAVITTHYGELKEFSFRNEFIENASMGFDNETLRPTYKLLTGIAGSSNALIIAKRLGLKPSIVNYADALISDGEKHFEGVLRSAEQSRREAEEVKSEISEEKSEIDRLKREIEQDRNYIKVQREKLDANMRKEAGILLSDYLEEARDIIDELKKLISEPSDENLFEARKLNKKLERLNFDSPESETEFYDEKTHISEGDEVFVKPLNGNGIVLSLNEKKGEARIKAGVVESIVKLSELRKVKSYPNIKKEAKAVVSFKRELKTDVKTEINLIGQNADEAIYNLDAFLDDAFSSGLEELRIVHGKGKGILRSAVRARLAENPAVAEFRDGKYGEGENGVTIVKLK